MKSNETTTARQKIGERLQKIRLEKGISTYNITKKYGLKFDRIKAIENGSSNYQIQTFITYLTALGLTLNFYES